MTRDERCVGVVNLLCPLDRILVRATAEVGEEAELQVVVRVYEAGEQQISGQIDGGCRGRDAVAPCGGPARNELNVSALDGDRCRGRSVWSESEAGSVDVKPLGLFRRVVRTRRVG